MPMPLDPCHHSQIIRPPLRRTWREILTARGLILGLALGLNLALSAPAAAQSLQDWLVAQLKAQGYQNIAVSRTFLGRLRVVGHLGDMHREVVVNPRTGEVLRDVSLPDVQVHAGEPSRPLLPTAPLRDASREAQGKAPDSSGNGGEDHGSKDPGSDDRGGDDHGGDAHGDKGGGKDDSGDKGGHGGRDGGG